MGRLRRDEGVLFWMLKWVFVWKLGLFMFELFFGLREGNRWVRLF